MSERVGNWATLHVSIYLIETPFISAVAVLKGVNEGSYRGCAALYSQPAEYWVRCTASYPFILVTRISFRN
jgi:hypothetical protein